MRVMLTSFGIDHSLLRTVIKKSIFQQMPPVSFRRFGEVFIPDYELLLLSDRIIMDEASFHCLVHDSVTAYSLVADTFKALKSEGRIETKDFLSILRPKADLLKRMVDHDLNSMDQWMVPLRESLSIWENFLQMSMNTPHFFHWPISAIRNLVHDEKTEMGMIYSSIQLLLQKSPEAQELTQILDILRDVLRTYLTYVNSNLILSHSLNIGFHDWLDFLPFYTAKFLSVGQDGIPIEKSRSQLEKLFTIPFPDLTIRDTSSFIKAINDKRIEDLRQLVSEAASGRVQFDDKFAKSVLLDVFKDSQRARKWRSITGYLTLPLGFIPGVGTLVQKAAEEGVGIPLENSLKRKHRWFYMLSEIAESKQKGATD